MDLTIHTMVEAELRERRYRRMDKPQPWHLGIQPSPRQPLYRRLYTLARGLTNAIVGLVPNDATGTSLAGGAVRERV